MTFLELEPLIMERLESILPSNVLLVSSLKTQNPLARNAGLSVTLAYGGFTVADTRQAKNMVDERWIVIIAINEAAAQTQQSSVARSQLSELTGLVLDAIRSAPFQRSTHLHLVSSPPVETTAGYQAFALAFDARITV